MDVCFQGKTIDCIRVDGGADEGPSHLEVQFRWTEWHLIGGREFTLLTTICLSSKQNGVLAVLKPIRLYPPLLVDLQRPNQEEYPKKDCKKTWKPHYRFIWEE